MSPFTLASATSTQKKIKKLASGIDLQHLQQAQQQSQLPQVPNFTKEKRTRSIYNGGGGASGGSGGGASAGGGSGGRKFQKDATVNYYELYTQLLNKYELLVADNIKQKDLFKLRQETFVRREKRSKEKLDELTEKLRLSVTMKGDSRDQMDQLHSLKKMIQTKIQTMKGETHKQLEERQAQYQRHVDDIIQDYRQQLAEERRKNSTGVKEWNEKSRTLKENLKSATVKAVELDEKNNILLKENQRLKIQYQAQQDDREYLSRINAKLKRENEKLRMEMKEMELEMETYKTIADSNITQMQNSQEYSQLPSRSESALGDSTTTSPERVLENGDHGPEREKRMLETINKLKKMLDQERKNGKAIRNAHMFALSERSELEVFLRQCIDDVRLDISRHQAVLRSVNHSPTHDEQPSTQLQDFTIMDRQKVVDILLSKERVLKLLYQRTFPTKILSANDGSIGTIHYEEEHHRPGLDPSVILSGIDRESVTGSL